MEERGWDTTPTAGGVYELLRDLSELVPGIFELEIEELIAGLRPDDAGQPAGDRPRRARGPDLGHRPSPQRHPAHARHGRPRGRARCSDEPLPEWAAPADPLRFAGVHA